MLLKDFRDKFVQYLLYFGLSYTYIYGIEEAVEEGIRCRHINLRNSENVSLRLDGRLRYTYHCDSFINYASQVHFLW